ncbi:MAG: PorV/PorQ family protein, partial [Candidatus Desantisbacteria bacterium]
MKRTIISFFILGALSLEAGIHKEAGITGAQFLEIAIGARACGMGGAFSAIADDASAIYWNPAGLGQITQEKELYLIHTDLFQNISCEFIGLVYPLEEELGAMGLGIFLLGMDDIKGYDTSGDPIAEFGAGDRFIALSFAQSGDRLLIGGSVKFLHQEIAYKKANSTAFDVGILYKAYSCLTFGGALQNIGKGIKFDSMEGELPLKAVFGVGYRVNPRLILSADINKSIDDYIKLNTGLEYQPLKLLSLRLGYNQLAVS